MNEESTTSENRELFFKHLTHQRIKLLRHLAERLDNENNVTADAPPHNLALISVIDMLVSEIKWNANERLIAICNKELENERR